MEQKQSGFNRQMRSSVIFSIVLFAVVLAAGIAVFAFTARRTTVRPSKNEAIVELVKSERERIEGIAKARLGVVSKMAELRVLPRYFVDTDNEVLRRMAEEEIGKLRGGIGENDAVFWASNINKKFYYNGDSAGVININDPAFNWYGTAFAAQEKFSISAQTGFGGERAAVMRIVSPVYNQLRVPIGVVGIDGPLTEFIGEFFDNYEGGGDVYFFNVGGEFALSHDERLVTAKRRLDERFGYVGAEILAAAHRLDSGEARSFNASIGQIGVGNIPLFGWYVLVISPHSHGGHDMAMMWFLFSMIVILGAVLVVFNIFILNLFKPLRNTMEALEVALKVKDDFLARMSHEIRTPMNAITGMAELALREEMSHSALEHVYTIKQAGANLLSIINDILDLSKIGSGKLEIVPGEYLFGSLVNDVVSIIRMRVVDSGVRFVVNINSAIPGTLVGDEVRVRQILLNMLSNAVKYTKDGFISLVINGKIVEDDTVLLGIEVADTGRGIKQEDIGKLFSSFVQVDVASNKGIEGTGLGLVITKTLTTAMGGSVGVSSVYGKGSTFTVTLPQEFHSNEPVAKVDHPENHSILIFERRDIYANSMACTIDNLGVRCTSVQSLNELCDKLKSGSYNFVFVESTLYEDIKSILEEYESDAKIVLLTSFGNVVADNNLSVISMPAHSISVANILNGVSDGFSYHTDDNTVVKFNASEARVLIVDDIKTNLEVTRGLLSPYAVQVDMASSGREAIKMVKENSYDLIFMDHMMPDMNGIEATKRIRDMGGVYAKVPIVALTANAVAGAREMFLENNFNAYLSKPIDIPNLNAVLEKWIPKRKQKLAARRLERSAGAASELSIEGLNTKVGISRMGGSAEAYLRTISIFRADCREKITEIKKCLDTGNLPLFTINVHALKGASANIGAMAVSEAAKALEAAGKREDRVFIREHIERLLTNLETLLRNIDNAVQNEKKKHGYAAPAADGDKERAADWASLKSVLADLRAAIDDLDPDAINSAAGKLRRMGGGAKIEAILQNTLIGEFDTAIAQIETFLKEAAR